MAVKWNQMKSWLPGGADRATCSPLAQLYFNLPDNRSFAIPPLLQFEKAFNQSGKPLCLTFPLVFFFWGTN